MQRCAEFSEPLCFPVHSHWVTLGAQGSERGLHLLWGRPQASVASGLIPRGSTQQQTCLVIDTWWCNDMMAGGTRCVNCPDLRMWWVLQSPELLHPVVVTLNLQRQIHAARGDRGTLYAPGSDPHAVQIHLLGPGYILYYSCMSWNGFSSFHMLFFSGFRCIYLRALQCFMSLWWVAWGALVQHSWAKASWSQYCYVDLSGTAPS